MPTTCIEFRRLKYTYICIIFSDTNWRRIQKLVKLYNVPIQLKHKNVQYKVLIKKTSVQNITNINKKNFSSALILSIENLLNL